MAKADYALVVKKYNGDDSYSYAVFYKADLPKGHRGPVFCDEAGPLVAGCSKSEALSFKKEFEERCAQSEAAFR